MRVYWDLENLPFSHTDPLSLRKAVTRHVSSEIREFRAYASVDQLSFERREACFRSGWTLIDTPTKQGKQSADARIVMDVLTSDPDQEVGLISGDGDYVPLLLTLSERGRRVLLVYDSTRRSVVHRDLLVATPEALAIEENEKEERREGCVESEEEEEEEEGREERMCRRSLSIFLKAMSVARRDEAGWVQATDVGEVFHKHFPHLTKQTRKESFRKTVSHLVRSRRLDETKTDSLVLFRLLEKAN